MKETAITLMPEGTKVKAQYTRERTHFQIFISRSDTFQFYYTSL